MLTSLARDLREMVGLPTLYGSHQPVAFHTRSLAGASLDGGLPPWMAHGFCELTEHDVEADTDSLLMALIVAYRMHQPRRGPCRTVHSIRA